MISCTLECPKLQAFFKNIFLKVVHYIISCLLLKWQVLQKEIGLKGYFYRFFYWFVFYNNLRNSNLLCMVWYPWKCFWGDVYYCKIPFYGRLSYYKNVHLYIERKFGIVKDLHSTVLSYNICNNNCDIWDGWNEISSVVRNMFERK